MSKSLKISSDIKYLTTSEFENLISAIDTADPSSRFHLRNKAAILIAEYCGLRASEVGRIRFDDFKDDPGCPKIYCRRLKGSASNTIRIVDDRVYKTLKEFFDMRCKDENHGEFLFASKSEKPIDRRTLDFLFKFYCSFSTIKEEKWHFHVLKHTRAMELIENPNGIDIREVQWWLGHKYIANTMIYMNFSVRAQDKLYSKLMNN